MDEAADAGGRVTQNAAKAARERAIFTKFVESARLPVLPGSITSRDPPEPDILCEFIGGGSVAFELVELVDRDLAHMVARAIAHPDEELGVWFDDPTLDTIAGKLEKTYETPHPMELLAYGDDPLDPYEIWVPKFAKDVTALFDASKSRFRRLWVVNLGRIAAGRPVWLVHPSSPPGQVATGSHLPVTWPRPSGE